MKGEMHRGTRKIKASTNVVNGRRRENDVLSLMFLNCNGGKYWQAISLVLL
jgi:hypothetical protein